MVPGSGTVWMLILSMPRVHVPKPGYTVCRAGIDKLDKVHAAQNVAHSESLAGVPSPWVKVQPLGITPPFALIVKS